MNNTATGFIRLSRRFFQHHYWLEKRVYSKVEAWLDLMQSARFEEEEETVVVSGRYLATIHRGQIATTILQLSVKWSWNKSETYRFICSLKEEGMITVCVQNKVSIITLCNYEKYNENSDLKRKRNDNETTNTLSNNVLQETLKRKRNDNETHIKRKNNIPPLYPISNDIVYLSPPKEDENLLSHDSSYLRFMEWVNTNCPSIATHLKPINEVEYARLTAKYPKKLISETLEQIENRKDLRKRYTNLYRTLLNWLKNATTTK